MRFKQWTVFAFFMSSPPCTADQIRLIKTGGLILARKSMVELEDVAFCYVEPLMRLVQSMKGNWNNEKMLSSGGAAAAQVHTIRRNYRERRKLHGGANRYSFGDYYPLPKARLERNQVYKCVCSQ